MGDIPRNERLIEANGVDLCVETIGDPTDPAILLVAGAAASMDWWEDGFCQRLAGGSRYVIRYDHRDTGRSVSYEPGAPPYTFRDLAGDAVGLLDSLGLAGAHLAGISMGGAIAQLVALDHPDRVLSLTLLSTSPGAGDPDLPPMTDEFRADLGEATTPDWSDRTALIDHIVESQRPYVAPSRAFDEAAMRELAARIFDRTTNMESSVTNHFAMQGGEPWRERLGEVTAPTLVMHGTEDPMFPYGHAVALAKEIPGANLVALERTGHELPRDAWDVVVPAILRHTSPTTRPRDASRS